MSKTKRKDTLDNLAVVHPNRLVTQEVSPILREPEWAPPTSRSGSERHQEGDRQ